MSGLLSPLAQLEKCEFVGPCVQQLLRTPASDAGDKAAMGRMREDPGPPVRFSRWAQPRPAAEIPSAPSGHAADFRPGPTPGFAGRRSLQR